ncbi:hypothetical protein [Chitinophaga rhizophila]|uniref:WD40 repeat protein n=1 Tax=Chitinophaga rhizophila TaxID=2866212 RepID=A0ABS7G7G1_9BACT|nr:hypothetical protein [Chitinophaga rhizophila]MBW8683575.1 hypothetical protein [Chitinophaga rhizophila]
MTFTPVLPLLLFCSYLFAQSPITQSQKYLGENPPGSKPVKFAPGIISLDNQHEFGSVFSNNGDEFFYAVDKDGKTQTKCVKFVNGKWSEPFTILSDAVFSYNDPMLSPDGNRLYFISNRPLTNTGKEKDYDIWYVERTRSGWSLPVNAGAKVNSVKHEYYISFTKKGSMYFSSNRMATKERTNNFDIYSLPVTGKGSKQPVSLPGMINTEEYEADVYVAGDESYVIFCAVRAEGYGAGDLYISFKKKDGTWTKAKNMGSVINTSGHELCPFVTADGKYLFYTSNKDIYWVNASIIDILR